MFLKSLKIEEGESLIRNISFRKGINLIVDETETRSRKESGNNVGKTTVLRLIDYCLGSSGKNIYQDPEFRGRSNSVVENYLTGNNVCITLVLKDDLDIAASREIVIRRNFLQRSDKILEINGEPVKSKDFPECLKSLIFNSSVSKPTFKQIVSKNVRDEKNRLINTVKVLHPATKYEEYEALYLFWLGIDIDVSDRKQKLFAHKKIEEDLQKRLKKEKTISQIKQSLLVVDSEIEELEAKKDNFSVNENYENEVQQLNLAKAKINRLSTQIARIELRIELIKESAGELEDEISNVNVEKIKSLYEEAKFLMPSIQKTFDETLSFHNGMVLEKKKYITNELPSLESELLGLNKQLEDYLSQEKALAASISKSDTMNEFQSVVLKLNQSYESKGSLEEQKRLWESSMDKLGAIKEELKKIDQGIDSLDDKIQKRVSEFNKFFSKLSNDLYGEKYVLSADKNPKGYELNISSVLANPGTGKKKGEMAAFDLSYILFADHMGIECLHFVLQDQIENIHDNQITSILTDFVENNNCQYVLSVLRDKLPSDIDVSKFEVVSLSQNDKLFRV
ncbi:DUF2326 domain-containing protein [Verrucomicrobiaceae bacterium 5K15]|uniref:DUF2326 domain-containing protein n=1 Tax=Oceaniferula flava TaxID=2800421 RepID=A0AAE2V8F7_9BACT|nr:DUF2326 domain-containing protein [Oceaniferula flavus]MBK1855492.1 DUF2326 domain-containing protein [Oceaniferula flavus]MBM1136798.1 DUF2326 domain-containing protein [Oceaniferula flavus]